MSVHTSSIGRRVERAIRYIRDSYFAARSFHDLADLNAQATAWCTGTAADRPCPEDRTRRVREVFAEEQHSLLPLPDNPFPCEDREETTVRRWPYVRFDLNDYSVPYTYVRRAVVVYATLDTVRVVEGTTVIASHTRSYDKGEQIEKPEHVAELVAFKRAARHHSGLDRLHHACANTAAFFAAVAARQGNLGAATTGLITLLDLYGASALDAALGTALHAQAAHLAAVRQILEQRRHAATQPPPIPVALSEPQLRDIVVHPHELGTYDQIHTERTDDDTDKS